MKKIFYLTPGCFDKGGISRYSRYQIQALREIVGYKNLWVASLMGKTEDSFEDDFNVDYAGSSNSKWQQVKFALRFILKALTNRPTIIHVAHVNFSGLAVLVARLIGAKTILNVYGLEVWSKLSRDASWGLQRVHEIISDCHNTKQYLVDKGTRDENDITVIWDCVDLDKFKPAESETIKLVANTYSLPQKDSRIAILTLGRIAQAAKHKGYHRLIKTFSKLDLSKYYLVIAGKGDMVEELKDLTNALNVSESVFFTGMVHENDMSAIYSYADIFSLVSQVGESQGEGIPLTPLEAMACGTPIIVGNMDGSRESILDQNGICIESQDIVAHVKAIDAISADIENYAENAYNTAVNHFSYSRFKEETMNFLKPYRI